MNDFLFYYYLARRDRSIIGTIIGYLIVFAVKVVLALVKAIFVLVYWTGRFLAYCLDRLADYVYRKYSPYREGNYK